jgi:hypothetical protein
MRILLRKHNNKFYVWHDATYVDGRYYLVEDGKKASLVYQTSILAVDGDDRANYVTCIHCGATIKNDHESIEAHFAEQEAKRNCLSCEDMMHYGDEKDATVHYTKNEDGTYHFTKECNTKLGCSYASYYTCRDINTEEAKDGCKYFLCRKRGVAQIDDAFVKYPGLFNKQITIDWLVQNGFVNKRYMGGSWNEWTVDLGLRGNTLHAVVNEMGIVDRFFIHHRYERYTAYYSEKYDKLFFVYGDKYMDIMPDNLSQAKYNSAKKVIAKLYKEAK